MSWSLAFLLVGVVMSVLSLSTARSLFSSCRSADRLHLAGLVAANKIVNLVHSRDSSSYNLSIMNGGHNDDTVYTRVYYRPDLDSSVTIVS